MKPISSWWAIGLNALAAGAASVDPSAVAALAMRYPWIIPVWGGVNAVLQAVTNKGPATAKQ